MQDKLSDIHVVVVGAGFAGLRVTHRLARAGLQVTVIDRHNYHLFQPLLYQVATTGLNPSEITSTIRQNFSHFPNVTVVKAELTGLDKEKKLVLCDQGALTFSYDYLVLCAGGKVGYFGNDAWSRVAPGLKTLEDATAIRNRFLQSFEEAELATNHDDVKRLTSVVIIGGGPTGVELAGAFAELRSQVLRRDFRRFKPQDATVSLIEGGPSLLAGYDAGLSDYTQKRLRKRGVDLYLNERVLEVSAQGVRTANHHFQSANIIWAAGVEGLPLAKHLAKNVTERNGILVNPDLSLPEDPHLYACGDMATVLHDPRYPRGLPGVAQVAMQQGELTAHNILAHIRGKETKPFQYFDKGKMATIGRTAAVAETGGFKVKGLPAWLTWLFIHVLYLIEFQDRVVVFLRWIWSYLTWNWGVRIIFPNLCPSKSEGSATPSPSSSDDLRDSETSS